MDLLSPQTLEAHDATLKCYDPSTPGDTHRHLVSPSPLSTRSTRSSASQLSGIPPSNVCFAAIVRCPWLICTFSILFTGSLLPLSLHISGFPDTSNPLLGLEARRLDASYSGDITFALQKYVSRGVLDPTPGGNITTKRNITTHPPPPVVNTTSNSTNNSTETTTVAPTTTTESTTSTMSPEERRREAIRKFALKKILCSPEKDSTVLWFKSDKEDLFTQDGMRQVCHVGQTLRSRGKYREFCQSNGCCDVVTISSVIHQVMGNHSGFTNAGCDIDAAILEVFKKNMTTCFNYADVIRKRAGNEWMMPDYYAQDNLRQRDRCLKHAALWHLLFDYLLPISWKPDTPLHETMAVLSVGGSKSDAYDVYSNHVEPLLLQPLNGTLRIAGVSLYNNNGKYNIAEALLFDNLKYAGAAFAVIFLITWLHTGSFFISASSFVAIIVSLCATIFIYQLTVPFFPYLNMVCVFVLVGIGADDVFVYVDMWKQSYALLPPATPLANRVAWTTKRAARAMGVTTVTTAGAFLANISSSVTAIRVFGIFSGMAILSNYLLLIIVLPCLVVITTEGWIASLGAWTEKCWRLCLKKKTPPLFGKQRAIDHFFEHKVGEFAYRFRILLAVFFLLLGCATFPIALMLSASETQNIPLLNNHPIEDWIEEGRNHFNISAAGSPLSFRITFGVDKHDNGDLFTPYDRNISTTNYDAALSVPKFTPLDVTARESQLYLVDLCENVTQQEWYRPVGNFHIKCWPIGFRSWVSSIHVGPCRTFPVQPEDFTACVDTWIRQLRVSSHVPFLIRRRSDEKVVGAMLYIPTTIQRRIAYKNKTEAIALINSWADSVFERAPSALRGAWWSTYDFGAYSLATGLGEGVIMSAGIAVAVAFAVLLVATCSLRGTFFASLTMLLIVSFVGAVMVLLGWHLDIVESIILSLAVGVSVDFVCHLTHAYINAPSYKAYLDKILKGTEDPMHSNGGIICQREFRVRSAAGLLGTSVSVAALTTFLAGCAMLGSDVILYRRFGVYLATSMAISWAFAFFFFLPIMGIFGPTSRKNPLAALRGVFAPKKKKVKQFLE